MSPPTLRGPDRVDAVLRHGWQSWSASGWVAPDAPFPRAVRRIDRINADHPDVDRSAHESCDVAALADGDEVVLLGALHPGAVVRADPSASRLVGTGPEGCRWFSARGREEEVLRAYAHALAGELGARRSTEQAPRVWCSWYSLGPRVDEGVLAQVVADLDGWPFDVVQLDDGWQRAVGDWEPNERFGSGMPATAATLAGGGRTAGLWLAPLLADGSSELARTRPEWLIGDDRDGRDGPLVVAENWGGPCYALDLTREEVVAHVVGVVEQAVAWGFAYLKLDFLYAGALPGRHADGDVAPHDAYRAALTAIRDAVGDDVYLLGCGAPVLASLGLVDGLRIGPDVAPWWDAAPTTTALGHLGFPTARYALATSVGRLWLEGLVDLDPDVALWRARRSLLGPAARGLQADLARICGFRATSDPIGWLDPDEQATLRGWLHETSDVTRLGRHLFEVDGRVVDLSVVAGAPPGVPLAEPDVPGARLPEVVG